MTNLAARHGLSLDEAWSMPCGEFEDFIAGRVERETFERENALDVVVAVYRSQGASVTLDQLMGREQDFNPDMIPGIERTNAEKMADILKDVEARAEKAREARARSRVTRLLDPLEFDEDIST